MWNKLSMADKAKYILLAVLNGVINLDDIRETYNNYGDGGYLKWKLLLADFWLLDLDLDDYDYEKYYNDNPFEANRWLRSIMLGNEEHLPDGGKSGMYKTINHPTYPDLGSKSWSNNDTIFNMSDRQIEDSDRTLDYLGRDYGYNNGSTRVHYKGGEVLPTLYVTPKESYKELSKNRYGTGYIYSDTVENKDVLGPVNRFDEGGDTNENQGTIRLRDRLGNVYGYVNSMNEALNFMDLNGYRPDFREELPELTVTAKPKGLAPNIFKEDYDAFLGDTRVLGVKRAWERNPKYMLGLQDVNNAIGVAASLPIMGMAYDIPVLAGAMNLSGAYEGISNLASDDGIKKTYNLAKQGEYWKAYKSYLGDWLNAAMVLPAAVPVVEGLATLKNIRTNPNVPSSLKYIFSKKFRNKVNKNSVLFSKDVSFDDNSYFIKRRKQRLALFNDELTRLYNLENTLSKKIDNSHTLMTSLFTHLYPANSLERVKLLRDQFIGNLNGLTDKLVKYIDELGNITEAKMPAIGYGRKLLLFTIVPTSKRTIIMPFGRNNMNYYGISQPVEIQKAMQARNARLTSIIGEDGTLGGSTSLMQEGMLAGVPGDDDIITTAARLPKLKEKLQAGKVSDLKGTLGERISSKHLRVNEDGLRHADVDVILESENGKAVGELAHELYEKMNPTEYKKLRELFEEISSYEELLGGNTKSISEYELPISSEELYLLFKVEKENKGISDILMSTKPKHRQRAFSILQNTTNDVINRVKKVLDIKSKSYYGEAILLPKGFDVSNVEVNKEFLRLYGLPEELATNPEAMENIARYLYFSKGSITRGIKIGELRLDLGKGAYLPKDISKLEFDKILKDAHASTSSPTGLLGTGGGGNTTLGDRGGGAFGDDLSIGLVKLRDKVNNPMKLHEYLTLANSTITAEQANALNKLKGVSRKFKEGDTFKDVLFGTEHTSVAENEEIAKILDTDFLVGKPYGRTDRLYVGRYADNELKGYTYSKPNDISFEHGYFEPLNPSNADEDLRRLSAELLLDFKDIGTKKIRGLINLVGLYVQDENLLYKKVKFLERQLYLLNNKYFDQLNNYTERVAAVKDSYYRKKNILRDVQDRVQKQLYLGGLALTGTALGAGINYLAYTNNKQLEIYAWLNRKGYYRWTPMQDMKSEDVKELKDILKKYGEDEKSWEKWIEDFNLDTEEISIKEK